MIILIHKISYVNYFDTLMIQMQKSKEEKQRTTIYLSLVVSAHLKEAAENKNRSFTKQVENILRD